MNSKGTEADELRMENRKLLRQIEKLARISDRLQASYNETLKNFNDQLKAQVKEEVEKRMAVERKRKEEQAFLIQQSKTAELGHMIGGITHQWKQPLNAIGIIAQDLVDEMQMKLLNENLLVLRVGEIMDQLQFMSQTIDDFHNFYKPSRACQLFLPAEAIESVIDLIRAQLQLSRIEVMPSLSADTQVSGWPSEFKQVILNLLTNAKDAFVGRGDVANRNIQIIQSTAKGKLVTQVLDNAGGIDASLLPEKLFETYATSKSGGSGIGLSISRTIIEKMSGTLTVSNQNGGACFIITLPLA